MTTNQYKGRTGLDRVIKATGYSMTGLRMAYRGESAFRQEVWLAVVMIPAAFWLGTTWIEVAVLAGTVMLVLGAHDKGAGLAVVAMGKFGGDELNYASDIDVMFVGDGPHRGPLEAAIAALPPRRRRAYVTMISQRSAAPVEALEKFFQRS